MPTQVFIPSMIIAAALGVAAFAAAAPVPAAPPMASTVPQVLRAGLIDHPIRLDGETEDWAGVTGITVPLSGSGGADRVELKAAVRGDRIYLLAIWADPTQSDLHKPHRWDEASQTYEKMDRMEDRFAISWALSGDFTANKLDGSEFTADVWHWKANRSNTVGLAHDKWWRVSRTPFERSRAFETPSGEIVHLERSSDAGDRLYMPMRYYLKQREIMPGYEVNAHAQGSIADVKARGVWRDGRWYLELSRRLDTGHEDDVVVPANGTIEVAVAVFDAVSYNVVDGGTHSVSGKLIVQIRAASS